MATHQLHHTGLLTKDIERASKFYLEAFDGHWLFKIALNDDPSAQNVFGGPEGVAFKFCYIGFDTGAVELVEFVGQGPEWADDPQPHRLPHFALLVDDVAATVEKMVRLGGSPVWEEPVSWGGATVQYVADPDGNVIELFDTDLQGIVDRTIEMFPESRP